MTLILIGPVSTAKRAGGITYLFDLLVQDLKYLNVRFKLKNSNFESFFKIVCFLFDLFFVLISLKKKDHVSIHGTAKDVKYIAPLVYCFSKIVGFDYSIRKFAGNFDNFFDAQPAFWRFIIRETVSNSRVCFFETQSLVARFSKMNANTLWFPNVRRGNEMASPPFTGGTVTAVFVSRVSKEKGILDLVRAVQELENVRLKIAGPLEDEISLDHLAVSDQIEYVGNLSQTEVLELLTRAHVLVLPTYYEGEGYPGIIVEAFSVGLPVITTKWRSIPELVSDCGVLIEPKRVDHIKTAIDNVIENHEHYRLMSKRRFSRFDSLRNTEDFLESLSLLK